MKPLQLILITALAATSLLAQPREGRNKELGLSGSYQNYSSGSGSGSSGALLVSPRLGFYIAGGLELEAEILALFSSGIDPVYMLNGNVSYNFLSAGRGVPFLLLGYGVANTVPFFNVPITRTDFAVNVLNIGGGVKAFLSDDIALRVEYRYQKFTGQGSTTNYGFYSFAEKIDTSIHTVQFGFTVLL